jgi:D-alanine-D-alanine ligase
VEEYIEGREVYVGVTGNARLQTFAPWELTFKNLPSGVAPIATRKVKWDHRYQKEHGVMTQAADDLPKPVLDRFATLSKRIYRILELSGYARIDFRIREDGQIYVLEANPNPNLSFGEDFAESAEARGVHYNKLIERILRLGMNYKAAWKD